MPDNLTVETGGLRGLLDRVLSFSKRSQTKLQTNTATEDPTGEDNQNTQEVLLKLHYCWPLKVPE